MGFFLFYIASTALTLFVTYLYAFRGYERKSRYGDWMKMLDTTPRLIWICLLLASFVPVINLVFGLVGLVWPMCEESDLKIDHWLYRTPKEKKE